MAGTGQIGDDPARERRNYPKGGESHGNMQHGDNVKDCPLLPIHPQASERYRPFVPVGTEDRVELLFPGIVSGHGEQHLTYPH